MTFKIYHSNFRNADKPKTDYAEEKKRKLDLLSYYETNENDSREKRKSARTAGKVRFLLLLL
jgi:hypothetical protein